MKSPLIVSALLCIPLLLSAQKKIPAHVLEGKWAIYDLYYIVKGKKNVAETYPEYFQFNSDGSFSEIRPYGIGTLTDTSTVIGKYSYDPNKRTVRLFNSRLIDRNFPDTTKNNDEILKAVRVNRDSLKLVRRYYSEDGSSTDCTLIFLRIK